MAYNDPIAALKRQVGDEIARLIATGKTDHIAAIIGTDSPRVSELRRGRLDRFSLETLIRYAARLRRDCVITFVDRPWSAPRRQRATPVTELLRELPAQPVRESVVETLQAVRRERDDQLARRDHEACRLTESVSDTSEARDRERPGE